MSDVCLQEVKFILNPVLPLSHFFWSLTRFGLREFTVASPLNQVLQTLTDSLGLLANLSQRHSFLALSLKCSLVLSYNSSWPFKMFSMASSSESVRKLFVMCPFLSLGAIEISSPLPHPLDSFLFHTSWIVCYCYRLVGFCLWLVIRCSWLVLLRFYQF